MDVQCIVAKLKQSVNSMADEVKLQDLIQQLLKELRVQYRTSSDRFSPDLVAYLKRAAELTEAIHEFRDATEEAYDARTQDEAADVAAQFESLRDRFWPPILAKRLDKELRELAERAVSLPVAQTLKSSALHRQIVTKLESKALACKGCGKRVVLRETADGAFWGCSTFPHCFSRRSLSEKEWNSFG